jgi:hypothetical protein
MTLAISSGVTLTGGRLRAKWRPTWSSPAGRYLPELHNHLPQAAETTARRSSEPWIMSARDRLDELAGLPPGWDGAVAQVVSPAYITGAFGFISSDLVANLEAKPDLVPTYDGGLLIEWHTEAVDLIIELGPGGSSFYLCDNETHREVEATLGEHIEDVTSAFVKLGLGR